MLGSYARLTWWSYVMKPCKGDQKMQLHLEVKSKSRYKNHIRIMLGSCIRLKLDSYIIKPCIWDQKIT